MKFRGELENIVQDWKEGDFIVSFRVRTVPSGIDKLMDKDLDISVSSHREKRSLSANAYYWVLVSKLSDATHQSNAEVHNLLLRRYGVPETIDGELITTFVPEDAEADIVHQRGEGREGLQGVHPLEGVEFLRHEGNVPFDRRSNRRGERDGHRGSPSGRNRKDDESV